MGLRPSIYSRVLTALILTLCSLTLVTKVHAQQKRAIGVGRQRAVVVDERLAALRAAPDLSAPLLRRLSRGRVVTITGAKRTLDNVMFYRVAVTRRTRGWVQSDAVTRPGRAGEDERLLRLIRSSQSFDRVERSDIFLDMFPGSPLRPAVLMLLGRAAEDAADRLSREAVRRLDERELNGGSAPVFTYFMNYNGLDRYRRRGITFVFDRKKRRFHYGGASWREIVRRHPQSSEAVEARKRLHSLPAITIR